MEEQLEEEQFASGTRDAIVLLRTIGERYLEKNKEMYIVFVDLEKASDKVDCNKLMVILKKIDMQFRTFTYSMKTQRKMERKHSHNNVINIVSYVFPADGSPWKPTSAARICDIHFIRNEIRTPPKLAYLSQYFYKRLQEKDCLISTNSGKEKIDLGELMLSLCYLPTAGRLTMTVIKGRNFKAMDITGSSAWSAEVVYKLIVLKMGRYDPDTIRNLETNREVKRVNGKWLLMNNEGLCPQSCLNRKCVILCQKQAKDRRRQDRTQFRESVGADWMASGNFH
ncbi:hypothetical protein ANN_10807 [Periplaneta americana]|uniref:Reverse transcriptase domain-containing protein n=1 Tax=Periplaneta americana TaxID=6978 RepID=A0ABQ8T4T7_PERAM|nr:hypothetical protein ANN_10807 [Periplaneta americana]